jgi:hypothetical protein
MRTAGTLILEDIVEPTLIREAREAFVQRYDRYLDGREHDDALQVGNRRLMITVDLEPPFERRELIAKSVALSYFECCVSGRVCLGCLWRCLFNAGRLKAVNSPGWGRHLPTGGIKPLATERSR